MAVVFPLVVPWRYVARTVPRPALWQMGVTANLIVPLIAVLGHGVAFNIAPIFFGATCLVIGALIWRSGYLPRFVGLLMLLAGLCDLTASFAELLAPSFARIIHPAIQLPVLVGEATFCLWLLVKGVDVPRWRENHSLAGAPARQPDVPDIGAIQSAAKPA
jgi:hypothetical protein